MSLEATMLVLDNSAYAINGDFTPTRLEAQSDAVHVIFNRKLNAHPESEVGLMVMAGPAPQVLVTPTQHEGKLIAALHTIQPSGQADLETAIKVAQLALKHRQNKNQRQRIIVFCASPITTTSATLSKIPPDPDHDEDADVDLSIPSVPSSSTPQESTPTTRTETTQHKLTTLYEAVNSSDNSHLLFVEKGPFLLSERIAQSPILRTQGMEEDYSQFGGQGSVGVARTGEEDRFGVDPNLDPELAMALRMSLQEERARQAALEQVKGNNTAAGVGADMIKEEQGTVEATDQGPEPIETERLLGAEVVGAAGVDDVEIEHDGEEKDDLAKALALSRGAEGEEGDVEMEEEQEMARAIAMSMQEAQEHEATEAKKEAK
ncbi:hypothetical protein MVLG_04122 [Microbotryum lychnidis-dioicae p1A1 Lamole]|uniref:VWFA domain-containing protein n=1 Tax=Microbotryum lychnidis-dioicae (strain p1A1 Lamole / MvSl-1064) TaxID=683840 RepID=U5HA88_USTV1|nr:hypothetical protein MVLG_04122 [Microbotryum lychnidis-dioicae p1A1 Lamole]|eukprot:KDE05529.1 hypothetical protein MVLG_04122 [Microbotryum lychnidis-dioicae p1A1 Lamole]